MVKVNKKLILMLVLVLIVGVLSGCTNSDLPEGIENKTFLKDMNKLYVLADKSIADREYYKDDINKKIEKMDEVKYLEKLNDYEKSIYELTKEILIKVENDLTTGKKMIQSYTFEEIELIGEMLNN